MKLKYEIILMLVVSMLSCDGNNKTDNCNDDFNTGTVFPKMKNITVIKSLKNNKRLDFQVNVDSLFYNAKIQSNISNLRLTGHDYNLNLKIGLKKDSLFIIGDGLIEPIAILNKDVNDFNFWDYKVSLKKVWFNEKCKDTIFTFSYKDIANPEISRIGNLEFKEISLSRERGFLKILVHKKDTDDLWEGLGNGSN